MAIFRPGNAPRVLQESSGTDGSHPGHLLRRLLKHSTGTKSELLACAWLSKRSAGNRILECNETVLHPDPARARFSATLKGSLQPSSAVRRFSALSKHDVTENMACCGKILARLVTQVLHSSIFSCRGWGPCTCADSGWPVERSESCQCQLDLFSAHIIWTLLLRPLFSIQWRYYQMLRHLTG